MQTISIAFRGGLVSPGVLLNILGLLDDLRVEEVRFGLRQQLIADLPSGKIDSLTQKLSEEGVEFSVGQKILNNTVSSYAIADIFGPDSWLTEGVYKDLLDELPKTSLLKINITDRNQSFCPQYTGHINWIASDHVHYWHLAYRFPGKNEVHHLPWLVYSNQVAEYTKHIEDWWISVRHSTDQTFNNLEEILKSPEKGKILSGSLPTHSFQLPYYEGFNHYGNRYWLGIYRRLEGFPVPFLIDLCKLCLKTRIGLLYTTPWKSILIKNIEPAHRHHWNYLLGHYRINVRHASNELNWQVEDQQPNALALKRFIIREFDKEDVRTFGLCFAIQHSRQSAPFGSVRIIRDYTLLKGTWRPLPTYSIYYTHRYDPNSNQLILYRKEVKKEYLPAYLIGLCSDYYASLREDNTQEETVHTVIQKDSPAENERTLYQCNDCLTIYDESEGDTSAGIPAGTLWEMLPVNYCCQVCDNVKENFSRISSEALVRMD